jgi:hypothetical protein
LARCRATLLTGKQHQVSKQLLIPPIDAKQVATHLHLRIKSTLFWSGW